MTPNAEQVKTAVLYLLASSGPLYQVLIGKGMTPDQIGSLQNLLITFGPMVVAASIGVGRRTRDAVVAAAARLIADKGKITLEPSSGIAKALATDPDVKNVVNGSVRSHWLIGAIGVALVAPMLLGGCMWTLSNGDQVVLTPQNAVPLVVDKIKQGCAAYDATKVTADALTAVATKAINDQTVTNATATVQQIATAACPLVEQLVQTPAKPAG